MLYEKKRKNHVTDNQRTKITDTFTSVSPAQVVAQSQYCDLLSAFVVWGDNMAAWAARNRLAAEARLEVAGRLVAGRRVEPSSWLLKIVIIIQILAN